jgi:hypothetical protein
VEGVSVLLEAVPEGNVGVVVVDEVVSGAVELVQAASVTAITITASLRTLIIVPRGIVAAASGKAGSGPRLTWTTLGV